MRHRKSGRKLNRSSSHRWAMFRNMVTSLLEHERIFTTIPKAKELRRFADWMITLGKKGDLAARREALKIIRDKAVVHKLFVELAPRFQSRAGGFTRIVKVGFRKGDCAPMCLIELIPDAEKFKPKKEKPAPGEKEAAKPAVTGTEAPVAAVEEPVAEPEAAAPAEEPVAGEETPIAEDQPAASSDEAPAAGADAAAGEAKVEEPADEAAPEEKKE